MSYKDIVMGTNGETSPLSVLPYAYWAMDESNSQSPNSGIGAARTLIDPDLSFDTESLTFDSNGVANSAGSFNFASGGENVQNFSGLNNQSPFDQYSCAVWIKHNLTPDELLTSIMLWSQYNNPRGFTLGLFPGGGIVWSAHNNATGGNGANALGPALAVGQRAFLAGTYNRTQNRIRLYLDGVLVGEGDVQTTGMGFSDSSMRVGAAETTKIGSPTFSANFGGRNYNGKMAHLMIFPNDEISGSEISALYSAGSGPQGATLTLENVLSGSDVIIKDPAIISNGSDNNVVQRFSNVAAGNVPWTYSSAPSQVDIEIYKSGFKQFAIRNITTGSNQSVPVAQVADEAYN